MTRKKNNSTDERLFTPELKEIVKRLKRKEPELDIIISREDGGSHDDKKEADTSTAD